MRMASLNQIQSQFQTLRLFRRYFTPGYVARELLSFPYDYLFKHGRSSSPSNINLTLTSRCNLNCHLCSYQKELNKRYDELSCEEIESVIDSVRHNKPFIFLGGGEPLLRRDILQIIELVTERGLYCALCTNGIPLNKKMADSIVDLAIDTVFVPTKPPLMTLNSLSGLLSLRIVSSCEGQEVAPPFRVVDSPRHKVMYELSPVLPSESSFLWALKSRYAAPAVLSRSSKRTIPMSAHTIFLTNLFFLMAAQPPKSRHHPC